MASDRDSEMARIFGDAGERAIARHLEELQRERERVSEDELLAGITEALTFGGWTWTHIRRSDGVTMGRSGIPDLVACHPTRDIVLAWELKSERGQPTPDQWAWIFGLRHASGIDSRVIRPSMYDDALRVILRGAEPQEVWTDGRA